TGYALSAQHRVAFFEETTLQRGKVFFLVALPLLVPYIIMSAVLCFGLAAASSAEQQYLGSGMSNNIRTLTLSLIRSGVGPAQVFFAAVLATVLFTAWVACHIFVNGGVQVRPAGSSAGKWPPRPLRKNAASGSGLHHAGRLL